MVLKCSSHTCRVFSRISLSSSDRAAFLSSTRSLWLDNSLSSSATSSDWSRPLSVGIETKPQFRLYPFLSNTGLCLGPSISVPSVKCSESSMLVSLRLCLKGESKKCSRVPRGLEESSGVLRRDVLLSRAMRPPSITSDPLPSVPLSPCTDAISLSDYSTIMSAHLLYIQYRVGN